MKRLIGISVGLAAIMIQSPAMFSQSVAASTVVPEHYSIAVAPDLEKKTIEGNESIIVSVSDRTSTFTLKAINITIDSAVIRDSRSTQAATVAMDKAKGTVSIGVPHPVESGEATIEIHYHGMIGDSCCGSYTVVDHGRTYSLVLAGASQVFPDFDDMSLKATFDVSASVTDSETALSNGAIVRDVKGPEPGMHTIRFATSPKMSPYLFTLVVGQFACATGQSDGIPIRVCGPPEYQSRAATAVKAAESVLHFYDQYFDVQYPYKKLDMVGLPGVPGAMESTACILANETSLFEPATGISSEWLRNLYLGPIAHEIAHQWFGDLVTMQSQREFWLNEGMATWMSYKATATLQPQLGVPVEVVNRAQMGMTADSLPNVAPIRSLEAPDEITYQKSAAVMDMVEHYVGAASLRVALNAYVKRYSYSNATSEDLWNQIAATSGKPVDKIMASYITQPGIPVVSVQTKCSNGSTIVNLAQHRYSSAASESMLSDRERWAIPVCLRSAGHERCILLDKPNEALTLTGCGAVYANAGALGYYRVSYEPKNIKLLSAAGEHSMSAAERVNFLNDAWAEVQSKQIGIEDFMSAVSWFRSEPSSDVLETMDSDLTYLDRNVVNEKDRDGYHKLVATLFAPQTVGPEWGKLAESDHEESTAMNEILRIAGLLGGDTRLVKSSKSLIDQEGLSAITTSTIAYTATQVVIAHSSVGTTTYEQLVALLKKTQDAQGRSQYLQLLGGFEDQERIGNNLEMLMSEELSVEDARTLRDALFENPAASTTILNYFVGHWNGVQSKSLVTRGLFTDLSQLCDASSLNTLDAAGKAGTMGGQWQEPFIQARSSVAQCIKQRQELGVELSTYLRSSFDPAKNQ
jgi:aminopeptidase N